VYDSYGYSGRMREFGLPFMLSFRLGDGESSIGISELGSVSFLLVIGPFPPMTISCPLSVFSF
jgi:hypothetical protein